jgi:Glycogen recognition site of AMP-activated protein kinase
VVRRVSPIVAAGAALALSCAAPIMVRPGDGGHPTVFRVRCKARSVVLSGTMTRWRPLPLPRHGDEFELELELPPGRHEYRLEVLDDEGAHVVFSDGSERTADGFGGENAVVRVR